MDAFITAPITGFAVFTAAANTGAGVVPAVCEFWFADCRTAESPVLDIPVIFRTCKPPPVFVPMVGLYVNIVDTADEIRAVRTQPIKQPKLLPL